MKLIEELRIALAELQLPNGSFRAAPGAPPTVESTALAALGAPRERSDAAIAWLRAHQLATGAFPLSAEMPDPSWTTAVALIALAEFPHTVRREHLDRGAAWLVSQRGRKPSAWLRFLHLLQPKEERTELDLSLEGWPWHAAGSGWVEPTAFALLALRKLTAESSRPADRIAEGEALLLDRTCPGGGWNYGNKRVLDFQLEPFADVTAIALLALRQSPASERVSESIDRLEDLLARTPSGLALALGSLALEAYGRDATPWRESLAERFRAGRFRHEARSLALALLALERRSEVFLA